MVDAERLARLLRRITDDVTRLATHVHADPDALLDDEIVLVHRYTEVRDEQVVEQLAHLDALKEFVRALSSRYL